MSQTIKNLAQLKQASEKYCYYLVEKVAEKVKANIEEFIRGFYHEFSPKFYFRSWLLLGSVVKTEPKKIKDGYEVEVYIDSSIEYDSYWKGEHWNMGNTMYMANLGQHGRFDGGYPHLWDETYNDTVNDEEILAAFRDFMQTKGIYVTIR